MIATGAHLYHKMDPHHPVSPRRDASFSQVTSTDTYSQAFGALYSPMDSPSTPVFEFTNPFRSQPHRLESRSSLDLGLSPSTHVSRENSIDGRSYDRSEDHLSSRPDQTPSEVMPMPAGPTGLQTWFPSMRRHSSASPVKVSDSYFADDVPRPPMPEIPQQVFLTSPQGAETIALGFPDQGLNIMQGFPKDRKDRGPPGHFAQLTKRTRDMFVKDQEVRSQNFSRKELPPRRARAENEKIAGLPKEDLSGPSRAALQNIEEREHDGLFPDDVRARKLRKVRVEPNAKAFELVHHHLDGPLPDETISGTEAMALPRCSSDSELSALADAEDYQPRPQNYRGGVLGALLKLYHQRQHTPGAPQNGISYPKLRRSSHNRSNSVDMTATINEWTTSPPASGTATPTQHHWYSPSPLRMRMQSTTSVADTLVVARQHSRSASCESTPDDPTTPSKDTKARRPSRPKWTLTASSLTAINRRLSSRPRSAEELRITKHIAQTIQRQKYLERLCKALMMYGAPTHRLEEYMTMSARVLEIEAQFLYIPGAMIMSFDDPETHTTEVKLLKAAQGLDLGKLRDVHEVYKDVVSIA